MGEAIVNTWIIGTLRISTSGKRTQGRCSEDKTYSLIPTQNEAIVLSAVQGADVGLEAYFV